MIGGGLPRSLDWPTPRGSASAGLLELRGGDAGPEYAGTADLYYSPAGYIKQDYLGVWRMEDDCLYLKLSADSGDEIDAELPQSHFPLRRGSLFPALAHGRGDPLPAGRHGLRRTAPVHRVRRRQRRPRDAAPGVRDKLTAAREETKKGIGKKGTRSLFPMLLYGGCAPPRESAYGRGGPLCVLLRWSPRWALRSRSLSPDRCAQGYPCAYK